MKTFLIHSFILVISLSILTCSKDHPDKNQIIITRHSDIYWDGSHWRCPLCDSIVSNRDRSDIRAELYLQEWHDNFLDEDYFDEKICEISDEELFESIDLDQPELKHINKLIKKEMFDTAVLEFTQKYQHKPDEYRLYSYPGFDEIPFKKFDEFLNEAERSPNKRNAIILRARQVADPKKGYTINGIHFGEEVDFNKEVDEGWKFGAVNFTYGLDLLYTYYFTKDEFFLKSLEDLFNQFYEYRTKMTISQKYNPIWYELGIAGRMYRLIDIYRLIGLRFSADTQKNLLKFILGQARWLYQALIRNPFHYYNWQTANATSLGYAALLFPEFKESEQWLTASRHYMKMHFEKSFHEDGGHYERSVGYAKYAFSMYYRYILMMKYFDHDESWAEAYLSTLEKTVEFYTLIHSPIGTCCPFNDAERGKEPYLRFFADMADLFNRGDFLGAIWEHIPVAQLNKIKVKPRLPKILSHNFESSQYVVMRSNWNSDAYFLILNYGPFRNHAHYDALDFEIYANGIALALDAGLGPKVYVDSLHESWYKHPRAHNMVIINNAIPNKRQAAGKDVQWLSLNMTDYFAATHEGYKAINGTVHRRHIAFIKNQYWLIFDQIWTEKADLSLTWNLHSPLSFKEMANGFISKEQKGAIVLAVPDSSQTFKIKKGMADLRGIDNERSHREIDWLILEKKSSQKPKFNEFAVLIYPKSKSTHQIVFDRIETVTENTHAFRIKSEDREDWIFLSDGLDKTFNDIIEGDFKFGWFSLTGREIKSVSVGDLTRLSIKDVMSLTLTQRNNYENTF